MNKSQLWMTLTTLGREFKALDAMNRSRLLELQEPGVAVHWRLTPGGQSECPWLKCTWRSTPAIARRTSFCFGKHTLLAFMQRAPGLTIVARSQCTILLQTRLEISGSYDYHGSSETWDGKRGFAIQFLAWIAAHRRHRTAGWNATDSVQGNCNRIGWTLCWTALGMPSIKSYAAWIQATGWTDAQNFETLR